MKDRKADIIDALEKMRKKETADKQPFKARAYANVIKQVKAITIPITKIEDLDSVKGVGDGIKKKLVEILETGKLKQAENAAASANFQILESLLNIHGIGPVKAKQLVNEHGIKSIEELKQRQSELLNEKQQMGLKYWEDFVQRIPRTEMDKHAAFIKETIALIDPRYIVELSGSYRRGETTSGDIDVLITHPDDTLNHEANFAQIISKFSSNKYVTDIFAQGPKKCLAVCKAKRHKTFRRVDFMMTHKNEFPFALLYFTGSGDFNVEMRNIALEKGYSLSEYGLKCMRGPREGDFVNAGFTKEQDIFMFLDLPYIQPQDRKAGALKNNTA
jgi:DNA polymerase/3'-5' exonuclease PolX